VHLAPAADVTVAQFDEENRTIMVRAPAHNRNFLLARIDAVIQKGTDFDPKMRRITLGKPAFDETSKRKAAASSDLTLIENGVFVEAVLRLLQKTLSPEEFMAWITTPGVSELERLPGDITYSK
jgi:hypothetical protein